MSRTWQIILICITLCVICILIYTWWKRSPFEGFQAPPTTNIVTLGTGWYNGTNMEVSFSGTGTPSTKPSSVATNIIIFTISTPLKHFKFQLPVQIWKTVGTTSSKVADAKLFSYNNPNVVIQGFNVPSWNPGGTLGATTNPWIADATGIRWSSQDNTITPKDTIYTIQANFCDIEINKTADQCVTPDNDTLPKETLVEIETYDNYEQYNITAPPAPIPTEHTQYDIGSSLGDFDPNAPIPWDYDNMALNPTDVLWGNIHPNVSQAIFHCAYTRNALQSVNNLEYNEDLGWTYRSLIFERTWTGDDQKFMPIIQMGEFLIETGIGMVVEGAFDQLDESIMTGTKWGRKQSAVLKNSEAADKLYKTVYNSLVSNNQWNPESKAFAQKYAAQHYANLNAMEKLGDADKAACKMAYDNILGAEGSVERAANNKTFSKVVAANQAMYNRSVQALKTQAASINIEPGISQRVAAVDLAGSAKPSDARSVAKRVKAFDPKLKAQRIEQRSISSTILRLIGAKGAEKLASKSSGKLAVKLARAIGFTMQGQGLLWGIAAAWCGASLGTTCPVLSTAVTAINIFLDIFVISCCTYVPAILAAYIPDDAVCPPNYFNIHDAMAKLPGGEIGWQIISAIPGFGDGLGTFGPYLCSKVENGILTDCVLKTAPSVPGYFYDSTLSIFADTTKAAMSQINPQFTDSRRYTTNASPRNSIPAWSDSGTPPIWVDFSDSRMLDKMAQFYYNYSRKLAEDNGDGTRTFEYISKFYGVIASSEYSCDVQCEITVVTFYTSTGTVRSKQISPVDPANGTTYSDRRFYFYPIQVSNRSLGLTDPAYISASNIESAYARKIPCTFLDYDTRRAYVAGNNDTNLDNLMTDNMNRYIVSACTHVDGTGPTAIEVNSEGEYVGDALISLGDRSTDKYYPPVANINNPMLIALTNAYTTVPTDLGGANPPNPSLISFTYDNPLISFIKPYTDSGGTSFTGDVVQGVKIDSSNNPVNANQTFSGTVSDYIVGPPQIVKINITSNSTSAGSSKYAISVKERSPGSFPPTNDNGCSAIRNKVNKYGQTVRQERPTDPNFVAPSYIVTIPSTTPAAWSPYNRGQAGSAYRTGFLTQKIWSESYQGQIKSQDAISKEIAQGTAMGYIGFKFNWGMIPVGALVTGGIMSTNFDPDWSIASLMACSYQDTLKGYGTYIMNGQILTIQPGINNRYLYINRGPIVAFAPGYTPNIIKIQSLVLTQPDCINRTAVRRAVNTYNTQNTTRQVTKVLKIETDATNSKCLYLFETVPYNAATLVRDTTNRSQNGIVIQYTKSSSEYALIQPPTIINQFILNSDGTYNPPTGPGDFKLSIRATTFPVSGTTWDKTILASGAILVPTSLPANVPSNINLTRQTSTDPTRPVYTCASYNIQTRLITQFNKKYNLNPIISSIVASYVPANGTDQRDGTFKCIYDTYVKGSDKPTPYRVSSITMVITPANDPYLSLYDLQSDNYPAGYMYETVPKANQWIDIPAPLIPEVSILRQSGITCGSMSTCAHPSITSNLVNQFNTQMTDGKILKVRKAYTPSTNTGNVCDYEVEMLRTFNMGTSTNSLVQKENIRLPINPSPTDQCMWNLNLTGSNVPMANTGLSLKNTESVEALDTPYVWAPSMLGNIQNTINGAILNYLNIDITGILSNTTAAVNREVRNVYETVATSQNLYHSNPSCVKRCKDDDVIQAIIDGYYANNYPIGQYGAVQRQMKEVRRVGTYDSNTCQVEFIEKVDTYTNFISSVIFSSDASDPNAKFNTRYYLRQYQFNVVPDPIGTCKYNMSSIRSLVSSGDFRSIDISNNNAIAIMSDSSVVPSSELKFSFTGKAIDCAHPEIMKAVRTKYNTSYKFPGTNNFNKLTAFSTAFNPQANICEYTAITSQWFKSLSGSHYILPNINISIEAQWGSYNPRTGIDYTNSEAVIPDLVYQFDPAKINFKIDSTGKYQSYDQYNHPVNLPYTYKLPVDYNRSRVSTVRYNCTDSGCTF